MGLLPHLWPTVRSRGLPLLATALRHLLPYLLLVGVHLLSGLQVVQPLILADEVGYLGNARYLAGTAPLPDMRGCQFYHFGYSLLLLPAFWLFANPFATYKAALVINALLSSALYFPLSAILGSFLDVPRSTSRWIAFTCCLYPPLVLYSSFTWSENAFVVFYVLAIALFGRWLGSRSALEAFLFGSVVGFLYTIHPRALPVLAIVPGLLLLLAALKVVPRRQALLSVGALGAVFAATRILNGHLKATGWGGGGEFSAAKLGGRLLPGTDLPLLVERASGQLLYLAQASHGLFLLGLLAAIGLVVARARSEPLRRVLGEARTAVPLFALATGGGVFLASVASKLYGIHGGQGILATEFIHGRYNEALGVVFMALALGELCRGGLTGRRLAGGVAVVVGAILCLTVVVATELTDAQARQAADPGVGAGARVVLPSDIETINVPGVFPLVGLVGELDLYLMSLVTIATLLLVTGTTRLSRRGGMVVLMTLFASFALYNHRSFVLPALARAEPRLVLASAVSDLGPVDSLSYDDGHFDLEILHGLQYLLPRTRFERFNSHRGELPASEVVLSANRWGQARRLGARLLTSSGRDNALWVLPGEVQSRLSIPTYEGVTLGARPLPGIQEFGFHLTEDFEGVPGRWTNRVATLRVPLDPGSPPRVLDIDLLVPGRDGARVQLLANGIELWSGRVPSEGWSRSFRLEPVPMRRELLIKLKSDTFVPAESLEESGDRRTLGVVVRGIRLTGAEDLGDEAEAGKGGS